MRHEERMRKPIFSKSKTYPESLHVDTADIGVKVGAHYPGRSVYLPNGLRWPRDERMNKQKSAEAIVASTTRREGRNLGGRRIDHFLNRDQDSRMGISPRRPRIGTESRQYVFVLRD